MATAVLSPHLDDAVLSCWHVLSGAGCVRVVNVFAGLPPRGTELGWWDRLTGARDPRARVRERRAEDRAALAYAGRVPIDLPLLDAQHRADRMTVTELAARVVAATSGCDVLYAPAALGRHPDHELLRDAALRVRSAGTHVRLYADLPHAIASGWPTWVAADGTSEADASWATAAPAGAATVHALDADAQAAKLHAIRAYRTQLPGLQRDFGPIEPVLRYEVVWELG